MSAEHRNSETGSSGTILIIDRDRNGSDSLGNILSEFGYQIRREPDHLAALDALARGDSVDLVIAAARKADDGGLEFLSVMQRRFPDLPTIVVSDDSSVEGYLKAVNIGVFDYLIRPVFMPELNKVIRSAFRESRRSGPDAEHARVKARGAGSSPA